MLLSHLNLFFYLKLQDPAVDEISTLFARVSSPSVLCFLRGFSLLSPHEGFSFYFSATPVAIVRSLSACATSFSSVSIALVGLLT